MAFMVWQETLSVGVETIDRDHRLLIDLINQLHEAQDTAQAHDMVGSVLNVLLEYTERHFAAEERLMERGGYPHLDQHRAEHSRLAGRVREMKQLYDGGEYGVVGSEMLRFFTQWLANHIVSVDTLLRPWVAALAIEEDWLRRWIGDCDGAAPA